MAGRKVAIVIPAYNEAASIASVVRGAKKYGKVIVVDDCSTDGTGAVARRAGAQVIRNSSNLGYAESLNLGVRHAALEADFIVIMDADGQHAASDIPRMLAPILSGKADAAIGVRPYRIRYSERLFRLFSRLKAGIEDPLCGFKAFRADVYRKIGYFDSIGSVATEFMFAAKRAGFRVAQVPITIRRRRDAPRFAEGKRLKAEWAIFKAMLKVMAKYAV
ncbi:MAG: glycosyltransferase family 2 protein [Candidatus Micrarchaeota archaeon]|nr:glycosyltransferase family 2 protein [Candidatus Micrarchaeota archaeon]